MSDRDTLTDLITRWVENDDTESCDELAGWLVERGVRLPLVKITTIEGLDALPVGSIVRIDGTAWERTCENWWYGTGYGEPATSNLLLAYSAKADKPGITVLYNPAEENTP